MQWNAGKNAGFTTGTPWLAVNENYPKINVEAALADENSLFYTYQKLIQLRKENPIVVWGTFELIETAPEVIAYYRQLGEEKWLVVNNFSRHLNPLQLPATTVLETVIHNETEKITDVENLVLHPWQSFIVKVK